MTSQTRSLIPDFVSHYYLPGTRPFLNLSELSAEERPGVLLALDKRRVAGEHKRVFGSRYMDLRRRAEARLLELFEQAGGRPERTAPHYFVLGESAWYRGLAPGMQAAVLPLSELPSIVTSFTYPDSFTATGLVADFGLPYESRPYHHRAFRIEELPEVVGLYGLPPEEPAPVYEWYERHAFEKYIEVQVWSDAPIQRFLRPARV
jgi:hypothetical protein